MSRAMLSLKALGQNSPCLLEHLVALAIPVVPGLYLPHPNQCLSYLMTTFPVCLCF